ncbi:MAG TPA: UDP binding domain-containing protein, partial [Clostridiales bacterium]|nr:UDP binding domain-containing protein [Clostridiales bacterium]
ALEYCSDIYSACSGSDCIVLATEWKEFSDLDFGKLKPIVRRPVFIDLRNVYDPKNVKSSGFHYEGVGRK